MSIVYEEGRYRIKITDQQFGHNRNGKACAAVEFSPQEWLTDSEGHHRNEKIDGDTIGRRSASYFFANDENARISIEQLRGLGWKGESFDDLTAWKELIGKELIAKCVYETFLNDKAEQIQTERWTIFTAGKPLSERVTRPEAKATRELQSRFGNLLKGTATPAPTPAGRRKPKDEAQPAEEPTPGPEEGDVVNAVPF